MVSDVKRFVGIEFDNFYTCVGDANVIPIQYIGVQDCDRAKMSTNEVLLYLWRMLMMIDMGMREDML